MNGRETRGLKSTILPVNILKYIVVSFVAFQICRLFIFSFSVFAAAELQV